MGKITNYSKDTVVTASDKWVGSDFENNGTTKNFTPTSIAKYLNDNNVINIGSDLRYRYQTLNPGEVRGVGTISFESEIGASVAFSSITTFLLSKRTLKQNDVSQYLQFLNGGSIIINSADNQNLFGFYNVVSLSEYALNNNFYSVELQYIAGNGSILEDTDYIFSLIKDKYSSTGKEQVNSDWNSTEGVSEILNKPTNLSDFENDSEFITIDDIPETHSIPPGGTTGQILTKTDNTDYNASWQENYAEWTNVVKHTVKNNGNEVLLKGSPVYSTGSNGTNILVGYAGNQSEATSSKTLGILQSQLNTNGSSSTGFVVSEGLLGGLNTQGKNAGDPIWLGPNGTLIYGLTNKPHAPNHLVFIGIVTKVSSGNGEIFVKVQNGFELDEIHDVDLKTTIPIDGNVLGFNGTLWVNKTISEWLGFTPFQLPSLTNGSVLFSNGTTIAQDNTNFFWDNTNKRLGIGTTTPNTALDISGSVRLRGNNSIYFDTTGTPSSNYIGVTNDFWTTILCGRGNTSRIDLTNDTGIRFSENSTARMVIAAGGNIGIGTTAPAARLDVRAQGALSTNIAFRVRNSADTLDTIQVRGDGNTVFNLATGQSISFAHGGGTSVNIDGGRVLWKSGINYILGDSQDQIILRTTTVNRVLISNVGNVGIGGSTSARLDVRAQGALATDIAFRVRNSADTANIIQARGNGDVFIGLNSGNITTGGGNTAFGQSTLSVNTSGINNTAMGFAALFQNTTGGGNVAIGLQSLYVNTTGSSNTSIGIQSFNSLTSGNANLALGNSSAQKISDGNILTSSTNSIFIGRDTRANANSQTNQIVIGDTAIGLGSNTIVLGNDSIVTTALKGNILIGTTTTIPSSKLTVESTTQGFLPPRMTNAQRLAIASPAIGLMVYCTDMVEGLYVNKSTGWTFII